MGKAEGTAKTKVKIARTMLSKNMATSLIAEVTELTEKEIEALR